jgi:uncharacterized delta-60 repeat protein
LPISEEIGKNGDPTSAPVHLPFIRHLIFLGCALHVWVVPLQGAPVPGAVDPTFDPGRGPLAVSPGLGSSVLIQPDGKIVVAGDFNGVNLKPTPAVVRFNSNGSLDPSFDAGSTPAHLENNLETVSRLLALQANGQILLAGIFPNGDGTSRYLLRLNADGSLDSGFNPSFEFDPNLPRGISQAIVLGDGRILIGGSFTKVNGVARSQIARLKPDGSLDETFQPVLAPITFVVQSTGKIVGAIRTNAGVTLARMNSDGSLDASFVPTATSPSIIQSGPLMVQHDDRLIWTKVESGFIPEYTTTIVRLNADGTDDGSFEPFTSLGGFPVCLQSDGKLVILVVFMPGPSRLNADGTPDPSFQPDEIGNAVAQQPDGKLVTAGALYDPPYGIHRLFLDGRRDESFAAGLGLTKIRGVPVDRTALLPNGKIVIAGNFEYVGKTPRNSVAVLDLDGTVDSGFDSASLIPPHANGTPVNALAVDANGKILVASEENLVRLNENGTVDSSFQYASTGSAVTAIGLQPGGKIVITRGDELFRLLENGAVDGTFQAAQNGTLESVQPDAKILIASGNQLVRLNPEGALDSGFNAGAVSGFLAPKVLALQGDGKILVSRFASSLQPQVLMRLNPDGSVDQSFDSHIYTASFAATDQTSIYVVANISEAGSPDQIGIVRLLLDGSRDPNFSVTFNAGTTITGLLLQADGQLIVTGSFTEVNGVRRASIARVNGNTPRKLGNISTRALVGRGAAVEIAGFIITGQAPKNVAIRVLGPSLASSGLPSSAVLADPLLRLHDSSGAVVAQNDSWRIPGASEIAPTGLAPGNDSEPAIVISLPPGSYTAVAEGAHGEEGIALVEVYDLDPSADSTLANLSTRAFVGTGDSVMISGFIVRGAGPAEMVVRALGPSLSSSSVASPLNDPSITIYDQSGTAIAANEDWQQTQKAELEARNLGPKDDRESALIAAVPAGSYTALVRGAQNQSGVALLEVYRLDQ